MTGKDIHTAPSPTATNNGKIARLVFITGGARSGKSRYAQELALALTNQPVYVATARQWDDDFKDRIHRHRQDRDERWTLLEEEKFISRLPLHDQVAVVDCVTLWLTNFFVDHKNDIDQCLDACRQEMEALMRMNGTYIIVSNEIGMGLHADTAVGRKFTDLQGWMNQFIAQQAGQVILMVSGIPVVIKSEM